MDLEEDLNGNDFGRMGDQDKMPSLRESHKTFLSGINKWILCCG